VTSDANVGAPVLVKVGISDVGGMVAVGGTSVGAMNSVGVIVGDGVSVGAMVGVRVTLGVRVGSPAMAICVPVAASDTVVAVSCAANAAEVNATSVCSPSSVAISDGGVSVGVNVGGAVCGSGLAVGVIVSVGVLLGVNVSVGSGVKVGVNVGVSVGSICSVGMMMSGATTAAAGCPIRMPTKAITPHENSKNINEIKL